MLAWKYQQAVEVVYGVVVKARVLRVRVGCLVCLAACAVAAVFEDDDRSTRGLTGVV